MYLKLTARFFFFQLASFTDYRNAHFWNKATPQQKEKWLSEQAMDFERECRSLPQAVNRNITLAEYTELWLRDVAPNKQSALQESLDI